MFEACLKVANTTSPRSLSITALALLSTTIFPITAQAQIVPDSTLGDENSTVTEGASVRGDIADLIEGGAARGGNLFHSFLEFNVNEGQRVYFANPEGIESILSRITGGGPSNIFGTLGVDGTADLFLLNPNGIMFSENATLDIEGSFYATTGNAIGLGDEVFSATEPEQSRLLTVNPSVLFTSYLTDTSGDIENRGQLAAGQNLTLQGHELYVEGALSAGENLTLQAEGMVTIRDTATTPFVARSGGDLMVQGNQGIDIWTLQHLEQTPFVSRGNLTLMSDGAISGDAHFESGGNLQFLTLAGEPGEFVSFYDPIISANGDVVFGDYTGVALKVEATGSIAGGNIRITGPDTTFVADGSGSDEDLLASSRAAILRAGVELENSPNVPEAVDETIFVTGMLSGQPSGSIVVSSIDTSDVTGGAGGPIILEAEGNISVTGSFDSLYGLPISIGSFSYSDSGNSSSGGLIALSALGDLNIKARVDSSSSSSSDFGLSASGDGGDITLSTEGSLTIAGSLYSYITSSSSSYSSSGSSVSRNGGAITLFAEDNLSVVGNIYSSSGSYSSSGPSESGKGGAISLSTEGDLSVGDSPFSSIDSGSSSSSDPFWFSNSGSSESSNGGDITFSSIGNMIVAGNLSSGSSSVADLGSSKSGNGGVITLLSTAGNLEIGGSPYTTVDSGSESFSSSGSSESGDGGIITFLSDLGNLAVEGHLYSDSFSNSDFGSSASGNGGKIALSSTGDLAVEGSIYSESSSSSGLGSSVSGDGGTITLFATNNLTVKDDLYSFVNSSSSSLSDFGSSESGNGGAITLSADDLTLEVSLLSESDSGSQSFSYTGTPSFGSSESGNGGAITLSATDNLLIEGFLFSDSSSSSDFGSSESGNGGALRLSAGGDLSVEGFITSGSGSYLFSDFSFSESGDGGNITLSAGGDLVVEDRISSGSSSFPFWDSSSPSSSSESGDGGAITLSSGGNLVVEDRINSNSFSSSISSVSGDGGDITLSAAGRLAVEDELDSSSISYSYSSSGSSESRDGGDITLSADGNLAVESGLNSSSVSGSEFDLNENGDGGDGGNITLFSRLGDIWVANPLSAFSIADKAGNGGIASLRAPGGSILGNSTTIATIAIPHTVGTTELGGDVYLEAASTISGLEILTLSVSDASGNVDMEGSGNSLTIENLSLTTSGQVQIPDPRSSVSIILDIDNLGPSGNATIHNDGDITIDNVSIESSANGSQPAGGVTITSTDQITLTNSQINSNANNTGVAGTIRIDAVRLTIGNGGRIFATTSDSGNGGSVIIKATDTVLLGEGVRDFEPIISVEASGLGRPGNIVINTPNFVLSETARITATATETATNLEGGGSINLNADQMDLAGTVGIFAETAGVAPGGVLTLQPYQTNPDLNITLAPESIISASTTGSGRGGDLRVVAPQSITISGPGLLAVETSSDGQAGSIEMLAQQLVLQNGVTVSASTTGSGIAGDVTLTANDLTLQSGARVVSNTSGSGQAGDIAFNIGDTLTLQNAALEAATELGSTGNGGSIRIVANQVSFNNGRVAVTSQGQGQGGDITLASDRASLADSQIIAETLSSNGGELSLTFNDLLFLRDRSLISTTAGTAQAGGNGGNITVNNANGYIIAFPNQNSDITANAFEGNGGNITITTRGLFGIEFRPQLTPVSDITASSSFGLSGTVLLNGPDTGAIENSLNELAGDLVPTETLTAGSCIARADSDRTGSFVVTGSEGLPQRPGGDTISAYPTSTVQTPAEAAAAPAIQEPQGVYQLTDGRLVLSHECE